MIYIQTSYARIGPYSIVAIIINIWLEATQILRILPDVQNIVTSYPFVEGCRPKYAYFMSARLLAVNYGEATIIQLRSSYLLFPKPFSWSTDFKTNIFPQNFNTFMGV